MSQLMKVCRPIAFRERSIDNLDARKRVQSSPQRAYQPRLALHSDDALGPKHAQQCLCPVPLIRSGIHAGSQRRRYLSWKEVESCIADALVLQPRQREPTCPRPPKSDPHIVMATEGVFTDSVGKELSG